MSTSMKNILSSRRTHTILGFLVSAIMILWLVLRVDWSVVAEELVSFQFWILIPLGFVLFGHYCLRTYRWQLLLPRGDKASFRDLFDATLIGVFANFMLPLRAGEIIRPYLLSQRIQSRFTRVFVSIVVERFFDLAMVLLTFGLLLGYIDRFPEWAHQGAGGLSVLALGILAFLVIGGLAPGKVGRLVKGVATVFPEALSVRLSALADDLLSGAAVMRRPRTIFMVVISSLLVWLTCYLFFYLSFFLFMSQASLLAAIACAVIVALAVAAPSAPGFIGVYQVACVAAFALFGFSEEKAVAYAVVTHAFQYILFVCYGWYALSRWGLRFADLRQQSESSAGVGEFSPSSEADTSQKPLAG